MEMIQRLYNSEIDETDEKVVDTQGVWQWIEREGEKDQERITK